MSVLRTFDALAPRTIRIGVFVALSIALHVITVVGCGPFNAGALRPGNGPARTELHATLVTGDAARLGTPATDAERRSDTGAAAALSTAVAASGEAQSDSGSTDSGLALPIPDKWYTASEVDQRAEAITEIRLRYPPGLSERIVGKVRVRLFIDEGGVVRRIQIAESEPSGVFDEVAKRDWQDVRFSPARKNGLAVKSQKLIELTYAPTGAL